jgi:hypothetical protein
MVQDFQLEKCDKFLIALIDKNDTDIQVAVLNAFTVHYMCLWRDKFDWRAQQFAGNMLDRWEHHDILTKAAVAKWVQKVKTIPKPP